MSLEQHKERRRSYSFYLARANSERPTAIQLQAYFEGQRFKYSIGKQEFSIYPELWDKETQSPTTQSSLIKKYQKTNPHIKIELQNIKTRMENIEREIKVFINKVQTENKTFDLTALRRHLDDKIKKVERKDQSAKSPYLLPYAESVVLGMEKGTILINSGKKINQRYEYGTVKLYQQFITVWKDFEKGRRHTRFEDVDLALYDELIQFFYARGLSQSTIGRHIRHLKSIMDRAHQEELHSLVPSRTYRHKRFAAPEFEATVVYLTKDELQNLIELDKTDFPHYETYLDVFLVGCYTAMRYSDYSRITKDQIKQKKVNGRTVYQIEKTTKKTKDKLHIPVRSELEEIFKKYDYQLPRTHEQKMNQYIKEMCLKVGITELIEVEKMKGGKRMLLQVPKYKLISTHTARRTGVTNMYLEGIPTVYIRKITGHKTEKSFNRYLRVSSEEAAGKMADMEYFKGSNDSSLKVV